ncbi:MAG: DinB family protein [Chitinophagaceae bacterium]|nr:MAG: DinB family protein [Chitinophagaceae bacterium]
MATIPIPPHFEGYVKQVPEKHVIEAFKNQQSLIDQYFNKITENHSGFSYAEGKWTLKEMLQHIIDTERIMAYRALCIARGEKASLPGFDENVYAANSYAGRRSWKSLVDEMIFVRKSSVALFESIEPSSFQNIGIANGKEITPELTGLVMVGHVYHHKNVIEERYTV